MVWGYPPTTTVWIKLGEDQQQGKDVRLNLENARRTVTDLEGRLENRKRELQAMRHVASATPVVMGGALVIPIGLLRQVRGEAPSPDSFSSDPLARSRIERLAMQAVQKAEEARGCCVVDVSAQKCGWDLSSYSPLVEGKQAPVRHIEVKGRIKGASTVTVTRNRFCAPSTRPQHGSTYSRPMCTCATCGTRPCCARNSMPRHLPGR
jgi:hypothetical protein